MAATTGTGERIRAGTRRADLEAELIARFSAGGARRERWRYLWKRYAWVFSLGFARFLKRAVDVVGAGLGLIVLSPLFLVVAFLIHRHDKGPVLFWQRRVGQWGREFDFPKFRSMVMNAEALKEQLMAQNQHGAESLTFKMKDDPRITPVGRFIRKLSIDELPQLWCVLKGEMSLVGPRPATAKEVAAYTLKDRRRLDVKPGLTCIWQVSGRGDIPFKEQVELDVRYIESRSFWKDVILILKTVPAVLLGKGAY